MLNFPDTPSNGQVYSFYVWDGEKWSRSGTVLAGDPASDTNPLMNGVLLPGLSYSYARADHVHPSDTSRALPNNAALTGTTTAEAANITGNINISGTFTSRAKSHYLGIPSGNVSPPLKSEANIILYDVGGDNWCGMGTDLNGAFWIRTGLSGTPGPALLIDQGRNATLLKTPTAPTPATADNSTKAATTAYVMANPATGPYVTLSGANTMTGMLYIANADFRTHRGDRTGVVFLNNTGDRYLYYNGSGYHLPGAHAASANGRLWGPNDYAQPIINIRLAYVADYQHDINNTGLVEPYGGSCSTGVSGNYHIGYTYGYVRYRQFQIQLGNGGWYAVGYA
jgi:hypothetical protein